MRVIIQRVSHASVTVNGSICAQISKGLLVFAGIEESDTEEDAAWLAAKIASMRIFSDPEGKMNLSVNDIGGKCLLVSQFTLHALTAKGNRPSFIRAARPEKASVLFDFFTGAVGDLVRSGTETGVFGEDMQVELLNDGPVTIWMDSRSRE